MSPLFDAAWMGVSAVEAVAVGASLLAVVLTVRKSVWCWPVGLVGVAAYFVLFARIRLYADMGLQVVFLAQGVYGWRYWLRGGAGATPAPVRRLGASGLVPVALAVGAAALLLGGALARWTDASLPYLDSLLATTSLAANGLLARKVLESWWLWIVADVLYVGMFAAKGVFLTAGLYAVFLGLATAGLLRWLEEEAGGRGPAPGATLEAA